MGNVGEGAEGVRRRGRVGAWMGREIRVRVNRRKYGVGFGKQEDVSWDCLCY
jgi:hypothetical protein